ncbi:MAG: PilZ domain-containing protein [Candidatus Hydrogenedentes bacterium]|nr:PilZ domain-containing protein [Candidatus Hydrogenedentota bacterium]
MYVSFDKGKKCALRIDGKRYAAELLDVRDRVLRMRCLEDGFSMDSRGIVVELDGPQGIAAYFTRFLTSAPDNHTELVLLRSANLNCDELRSFLRVPTEIAVTVALEDSPAQFGAKLLNISSGGALMESDTLPEMEYGERIRLQIADEPAISVKGELVHFSNGKPSSSLRIGVRFIDVDDASVRALTWFVWKRVKMFFHDYS